MVSAAPKAGFQYVQEQDDAFLTLFPHRFDYIWAKYPHPGAAVEWKTESRHPLSDRLINQGTYLHGVRFGAETSYCLLDIDSGSFYHPQRDPLAISRIVAALEPLGLVSYIACTSSYSDGLHLYFPFQKAQSAWKLAIAVSTLLENAGFKLKPGQLEAFPDPKPYNVNGKPSLFNAHRLPMQIGSYLVDAEFQPIWSTQQIFASQWRFVQTRNEVEASVLGRLLKQLKRERYAVSSKAEKFINDLNAEVELGWTDFGQTNYLLGRITMREYIFRHVLTGGQPLEGATLVDAIVQVARSLPGYFDYCRHRHEIEQRAKEWARCIENSRYFHYGDAAGKFKAKSEEMNQPGQLTLKTAIDQAPTWNQQQAEGARDRIRRLIAVLLEQGTLPASATARFHALAQSGVGGGTLYRHRDLWHPNYLTESVEIPPYPPTVSAARAGDCFKEASPAHSSASFFPGAGSNAYASGVLSDSTVSKEASGRNLSNTHIDAVGNGAVRLTQTVQLELQARQTAHQAAMQMTHEQKQQFKRQASQAKVIARMQRFLHSGDPILTAEALAWAAVNPGLLTALEFSRGFVLQNHNQVCQERECGLPLGKT